MPRVLVGSILAFLLFAGSACSQEAELLGAEVVTPPDVAMPGPPAADAQAEASADFEETRDRLMRGAPVALRPAVAAPPPADWEPDVALEPPAVAASVAAPPPVAAAPAMELGRTGPQAAAQAEERRAAAAPHETEQFFARAEDEAPAENRPAMAPQRAGADIDVFLEGLPEEAIVFNVPEHLLIDETVEVRLVIQPGQQAEALGIVFGVDRSARQTGELAVETARVSEEMGASLVSETLEVTAKRPERQAISRRQPTEWLWAVKADEGGEQSLTLNLYAIAPGSTAGRPVRVYDRVMRVEVPLARRLAGFASNHWEWMWTFLLAPLGVWYTRRRKAANA